VGTPVQPGTLDETPVAVMGETGDAEVPVPTADDVSLPPRGALGMEKGGEVPVPIAEVVLDTVTIEIREFVSVVVSVSGNVIVVAPVVVGAVGAVLGGAFSLQGVGKAGDDEPVAGLPSVEESEPDGTGKYP
jgi:hypothetical protein